MAREIKNINIKIDLEKRTIEFPVEVKTINFRKVTKSSNRGLNTEYVVRNEEINIIGRGSKEELAIENFKEQYQQRMR